ncbi:MAG TPA: hypothetical protein VK577_23690, partial [Bradyrhizobium sp.]|nr:hypothetical protein [Bradyrhizobium sp.]
MYVGRLDIAILGLVFSIFLDEIERWLISWKSNAWLEAQMSTALRIVHGNFGRVALLDMDCSL